MRRANDCADRSRDGSACWCRCRVAYDLRYVQSCGQRAADLRGAANPQEEVFCLTVTVFLCHREPRRRRGIFSTYVAARKLYGLITRPIGGAWLALMRSALLGAAFVHDAAK